MAKFTFNLKKKFTSVYLIVTKAVVFSACQSLIEHQYVPPFLIQSATRIQHRPVSIMQHGVCLF